MKKTSIIFIIIMLLSTYSMSSIGQLVPCEQKDVSKFLTFLFDFYNKNEKFKASTLVDKINTEQDPEILRGVKYVCSQMINFELIEEWKKLQKNKNNITEIPYTFNPKYYHSILGKGFRNFQGWKPIKDENNKDQQRTIPLYAEDIHSLAYDHSLLPEIFEDIFIAIKNQLNNQSIPVSFIEDTKRFEQEGGIIVATCGNSDDNHLIVPTTHQLNGFKKSDGSQLVNAATICFPKLDCNNTTLKPGGPCRNYVNYNGGHEIAHALGLNHYDKFISDAINELRLPDNNIDLLGISIMDKRPESFNKETMNKMYKINDVSELRPLDLFLLYVAYNCGSCYILSEKCTCTTNKNDEHKEDL